MDGKDSVYKIIRSITDCEIGMDRELLLDYIMGHPTQGIVSKGLDNTENYGCGEEKEDEFWSMVLDQVIDAGLLKVRSEGVAVLAKGKKFLKKPTKFILKDDTEDDDSMFSQGNIDGFVADVITEGKQVHQTPKASPKSITSQRKMAIIQAIDRHTALDDFANNHNLDFDEVMDDVEGILQSGTKLDLNYFAEEVLGDDAINELMEYFGNAKTDNLNTAFDEYGDVYTMDELRLGRILYHASKMK